MRPPLDPALLVWRMCLFHQVNTFQRSTREVLEFGGKRCPSAWLPSCWFGAMSHIHCPNSAAPLSNTVSRCSLRTRSRTLSFSTWSSWVTVRPFWLYFAEKALALAERTDCVEAQCFSCQAERRVSVLLDPSARSAKSSALSCDFSCNGYGSHPSSTQHP